MVDGRWLVVDDAFWSTHYVTQVDRQFGVTAVLSGWENVAASQQDAFSWRALAQHLSVLPSRTLMRRALEVLFVFVFISSSLIF